MALCLQMLYDTVMDGNEIPKDRNSCSNIGNIDFFNSFEKSLLLRLVKVSLAGLGCRRCSGTPPSHGQPGPAGAHTRLQRKTDLSPSSAGILQPISFWLVHAPRCPGVVGQASSKVVCVVDVC